jgi:hypothetical protein
MTIDIPEFAPDEPVEVHMDATFTSQRTETFVLAAWVGPHGIIDYSLTLANDSMPNSISNLQSKGVWPRKVVPGWQRRVVDFCAAGIYPIKEVK